MASDAVRLTPLAGRPYPPVITTLALSPDHTLLAAAGDDHAIRLIDTGRCETARVLTGHVDWVRDLRFAPDGRWLYSTGDDGTVLRWDRDDDWASAAMVLDGPPIAGLCLCPSGERLAAVGIEPFALLAAPVSAAVRQVELSTRDLRCVRFSPDGQLLVAGGRDGVLRWIDFREGKVVLQRPLHRSRIRAVLFLDGGRSIASAGEDGCVFVVDRASGETQKRIELDRTKLLCAVELPDHMLAVGGTDNLVRVLDVTAGRELARLAGHTGSVAALAVSHTSLYSAGYDTTIRIWQLAQMPYHNSIARQGGSANRIVE